MTMWDVAFHKADRLCECIVPRGYADEARAEMFARIDADGYVPGEIIYDFRQDGRVRLYTVCTKKTEINKQYAVSESNSEVANPPSEPPPSP